MTNNNVDSHKVGCALTCMGEKANYISNNRIDVPNLKTDVDQVLNTGKKKIIKITI